MQWVTLGDVDVDIGANPSAEEADEGTESASRKVVDIVDSFRLVVSISLPWLRISEGQAECSMRCRSNQVMTRRVSWVTSRYITPWLEPG